MSHFFRRLILFLVLNHGYVEEAAQNKFVYEKEMSEHCMRRVVPSVFLGRHVVDAYAQVLYFSKSDLPYSCYVSVRAESGSNIILVVQFWSAEDLKATCAENPNQLLVYELGETFGGYWGPMPQSFIQTDKSSGRSTRRETYTIKATAPTTEPAETTETTPKKIKATAQVKSKNNQPTLEEQNYITVMLPLVNISGRYNPGVEDQESAFEDENFDVLYDVLPRQEPYQTTMMPLVQFSVDHEPGDRRWGYEDLMSKYSFGQNWNMFTPDYRLKHQKYNGSINRRLKLKPNVSRRPPSHKHSTYFSGIREHLTNSKNVELKEYSKYDSIDEVTNIPGLKTTEDIANESESWKSIEELMSAFNKTGLLTTLSDIEFQQDVFELLSKLNDRDNKESVYLRFPESSRKSDLITKFTLHSITTRPIITNRENIYVDKEDKNTNVTTTSSIPTSTTKTKSLYDFLESIHVTTAHATTNVINTTDSINITSKDSEDQSFVLRDQQITNVDTTATEKQSILDPLMHKLRTTPTIGTLLDHESWENLMRVAPAMAGRLDAEMPQKLLEELERTSNYTDNKSIEDVITTEPILDNTTDLNVTKSRDKRYIEGIMIEEARPHKLTTVEEVVTTTSRSIHISDIQNFAQLVELIDDDIHDRAALRYLSQYVGQPMFNLCSYENQHKPRYVQLFKSSRLVVAIGNFTLRSMQLVMTPAKMLFTGQSRCGESYLECQVSGNRVCIDTMCSCDGVANCGAPDIYDEDRLMCGAYAGLRHNVCLAAITFIAVLLTLIYMVHYWLGRCVPKVSEAFFIYTEGDENVLYLDTIMRSPHDDSIFPTRKSFEAFETDDIFTLDSRKEFKLWAWLRKLFPCCRKKVKSLSVISQELVHGSTSNFMFSFPELEIRRLINQDRKDTSVQTGESLEMNIFPRPKQSISSREAGEGFTVPLDRQLPEHWTSSSSSDEQRLKDELNLLKMLNMKNYMHLPSRNNNDEAKQEVPFNAGLSAIKEQYEDNEETEVKTQFYDPSWAQDHRPSRAPQRDVYSSTFDVQTEKQKVMPSKCLRFSEDIVNIPRSDVYYDDQISVSKLDVDNEPNATIREPVPGTSRDFMRFWGGSKSKKAKKKTRKLPRN